MSEQPQKNRIGALIFCLFVFGFPLLTVYFSKSGLDKYKDMRSEMTFLKDSFRVDFNDVPMVYDEKILNKNLKGKLILSASWNEDCQSPLVSVVDTLKMIQNHFNSEDQNKMLFFIHTNNHFQNWEHLDSCVSLWNIDTAIWKFSNSAVLKDYRFNDQNYCTSLVMLDGRVSRKDDSNDYLKGPLLCENYNLNNRDNTLNLLQNMAVIMPAKQRKSIQFKNEEKLY